MRVTLFNLKTHVETQNDYLLIVKQRVKVEVINSRKNAYLITKKVKQNSKKKENF